MTVATDAERQKQEVADWVAKHVSIELGERQGFACHLSARAVLNLSAANAFELLTHPQNASIFRGIDACTYRHILWHDSCGRLKAEVENVSVWRLLFFSGRIATRLAVSQDYHAGTMNIQLAPGPPRTPDCKQVPIEKLEARWAVKPLSECLDAAADILPDIPPEARDRMDELYCFVSLEQSIMPWGIPGFLHGAFKSFAKGQVQQTLEDVLAEAHRIRAGFPSLCPYEEVCLMEISPEDALLDLEPADEDAFAAGGAECHAHLRGTAAGAGSVDGSVAGSSGSGRAGAAAAAAAATASAAARTLRRKPSLRGHRLDDLCDEEFEMELDEIASECGASAQGSCTPMDEAATSDAGSDIVALAAAALAAAAARGR